MTNSIGIDIVDVKDFKKRIRRTPSLKKRLFTEYEVSYCSKKGIEHLAGRFAVKEAFAKACNLNNLSWNDVEVRNLPSGKPHLVINQRVKNKLKIKEVEISISHTKHIAVGVVMLSIK